MLPGNHAQHEVRDVVIPGMLRYQGNRFTAAPHPLSLLKINTVFRKVFRAFYWGIFKFHYHPRADGHVARSVRRDATRWMPGSLSYQLASSGNTTEEPRHRAFQYWRAPRSSTVAGGREFSANRPIGRRSPARGAGVYGNHAFMRIISQRERWNPAILNIGSESGFGRTVID